MSWDIVGGPHRPFSDGWLCARGDVRAKYQATRGGTTQYGRHVLADATPVVLWKFSDRLGYFLGACDLVAAHGLLLVVLWILRAHYVRRRSVPPSRIWRR